MSLSVPPSRGSASATGRLRHRRVPMRTVGGYVIVARPLDGAPVVLESTAALVWRQLDAWTTPLEIDQFLADVFPTVDEENRIEARSEILRTLRDESLLERS